MLERLRRGREEGFTLIELLVVVIIIGILAAIAIPAFLGQQNKATDSSAKSVVRNAATAVEAAYVDTRKYNDSGMIASMNQIEPSLLFQATAGDSTLAKPSVQYTSSATDAYVLSSKSGTGTTFTLTKSAGAVTRSCGTGCTW